MTRTTATTIRTKFDMRKGARQFHVRSTVGDNILELRKFLGSVNDPLSYKDLAEMIATRHPEERPVNASTVRRWERGEVEPDYASAAIMADEAGVGFEAFCQPPTEQRRAAGH